jgi:hypothetical protein
MLGHEAGLDAKRHETLVRPGFRERVEELMRTRWREPVIVLRLDESAGLGFDVPGRRPDGTVQGKMLIRQFFRNIARGVGAAVAYVLHLSSSAGSGSGEKWFERQIHVKGPAEAMVLGPVEAFRSAKGPWLVCSPSCLAIVDTGSTIAAPADAPTPSVVWEARAPQAPDISFRTRTLTWPDGSAFTFPLHGRTEEQHLRKYHEYPDTIHWNGRPEVAG